MIIPRHIYTSQNLHGGCIHLTHKYVMIIPRWWYGFLVDVFFSKDSQHFPFQQGYKVPTGPCPCPCRCQGSPKVPMIPMESIRSNLPWKARGRLVTERISVSSKGEHICVPKPTQRWKFQTFGRYRFQVTIVAVVCSTHTFSRWMLGHSWSLAMHVQEPWRKGYINQIRHIHVCWITS